MKLFDIVKALAGVMPNVAFAFEVLPDPDGEWDGDAPDPRDVGMVALIVDVKAGAIINGQLVETTQSIGNCYAYPGEGPEAVAGDYLPQLMEAALAELSFHPWVNQEQVSKGREWLLAFMRKRYEEEMA